MPGVADASSQDVPARTPTAVWLCCLLLALLAAGWALLQPTFRGPDERQHVDLVRRVQSQGVTPWPDPGSIRISPQVQAATELLPWTFGEPLPERDAPSTWPSFDQLPADGPPGRVNQLTQHPPLYYLLAARATEHLPGWSDRAFPTQVLVLRLLDVLLVAGLPWLCWSAARVLGAGRAAVAAAVVPLLSGELVRVSGSVSNDALLLPLCGLVLVGAARVLGGDLRRRTGALVGIALALALLTKGLALVLPPVVGLAYLVQARRSGAWGRASRVWALSALLSAGGGWWWVRNLVVLGAVQPSGDPTPVPDSPPHVKGLLGWLGEFLVTLARRTVMPFDTTPATVLALCTTLALVAACVAALRSRPAVVVLLLPPMLVTGLLLLGDHESYLQTGVLFGARGRYVLVGAVGVAAVAALGLGRPDRTARRAWVVGVLAVVAVTQVLLVEQQLVRYTGADGSVLGHLRSWAAWSPWPDPVLALVPVLAVAVALATGVQVLRATQDHPDLGPVRA